MRLIDPPKNGIYRNVPAEQYHLWNAVSVSWLHKLADSPATLRDWMDNGGQDDGSEAKELGTAVHCAVLEPDLFAIRYVEAPEMIEGKKTNKNTTAYREWRTAQLEAGRLILDAEDMRWCQAIARRVSMSPPMKAALARGKTEVSIVGEILGMVCKARVDMWLTGELWDVKTTLRTRDEFTAEIFRRHWHAQAWWYLTLAESVGNKCERFVFVAAHKKRPFLVSYHEMAQGCRALDLGVSYCVPLLTQFSECCRTRTWPGYSDDPVPIEPPTWANTEPELVEQPY